MLRIDEPKNRVLRMIKSAQARSRKYKLPFNLDDPDYIAWLTEEMANDPVCPYCSRSIALDAKRWTDNGPSLDRVVPERGVRAQQYCLLLLALQQKEK